MKLIFAQGNPGRQYERTRHNAGFIALDALADKHSAPWKENAKFNASIAEISLGGEKILLVKPLSFYNDTGLVARGLVDFYKLTPAEDVLVIHDDLALPFGSLRTREKGSDAGNNGIKSLNTHLGPEYSRLRIGIWNELRDQIDDAAFVLSTFTKTEQEQLTKIIEDKIIPIVDDFARGTFEITSHKHVEQA